MRPAWVDIHGEAPVGPAIGAVGREPEEGERGHLLELLLEQGPSTRRRTPGTPEPGIEGEVVDGPPRQGKDQVPRIDIATTAAATPTNMRGCARIASLTPRIAHRAAPFPPPDAGPADEVLSRVEVSKAW